MLTEGENDGEKVKNRQVAVPLLQLRRCPRKPIPGTITAAPERQAGFSPGHNHPHHVPLCCSGQYTCGEKRPWGTVLTQHHMGTKAQRCQRSSQLFTTTETHSAEGAPPRARLCCNSVLAFSITVSFFPHTVFLARRKNTKQFSGFPTAHSIYQQNDVESSRAAAGQQQAGTALHCSPLSAHCGAHGQNSQRSTLTAQFLSPGNDHHFV